jgi:hypothetical protein
MKLARRLGQIGSALAVLGLVGLLFGGCSEEKKTEPVLEKSYVGSATCISCHEDEGNAVKASGHAHKLNRVEEGEKPEDHLLTLPESPPEGYSWSDIAYVLGGFGWKVRFIVGEQGHYRVLTGDAVQWNIPTQEWVAYDPDIQNKPYNYGCFKCHTTGPNEGDPADESDDTWAEENIMCEACHGPGSQHAMDAAANRDNPDLTLISVDARAEACGQCHNRGGLDVPPPAKGGWIRHHEQYNELQMGPHGGVLDCTDCHNPHVGVRKGQFGGIVKECQDCHSDHATVVHPEELECEACHMPYASKSAVAFNKYKADVRTHIFKIHVGTEGKEAMFQNDGSEVKPDFGVTLDVVCYQCHKDPDGVGGDAPTLSMEELAAYAEQIHPDGQPEYAGSATCGACHSEQYEEVKASGHAHKLNKVVDGQPPSDPLLTLPDSPPEGYSWSDIAYVLGGFGWKVRFIVGEQGNYRVLTGDAVQWNIPTQEWVPYDPDIEVKPYNYGCFRCHTTGPDEGDPGDDSDDTWAEENIMCEACHGPGREHAQSRDPNDIQVDDSALLCGGCHYRGAPEDPAPARGGFIRHHEQYNEMRSAGHQNLNCVDCHDAHEGVRGEHQHGIKRECESCHAGYADGIHEDEEGGPDECDVCHMPFAAKSAVAFNSYKADVRSHVFKIHVGPEGKDSMFENDALKVDYGVTLDFVCYQCHKDPQGEGGDAPQMTLDELAAAAENVHHATGKLQARR